MPKIKRDITLDLENTNKNYEVENIINEHCDTIQPIWEAMRIKVESLGYEVHVKTAISDGKLEVSYRKKI